MALYCLFSVTALIFASVGFGGGSTYTALLVLFDTNYKIIPVISLACNIVVVSGGVFHFSKEKHLDLKKAIFLVYPSVPMAFLGGYLVVDKEIFITVLALALLLSGVVLMFHRENYQENQNKNLLENKKEILFFISGGLGFLSGITGIGGGIFLAPILHFIKWGNSRKIAAISSFFILLNSLSGLGGQFLKHDMESLFTLLEPYIFLPVVVLIFGQVGSILCARVMRLSIIKRITGAVILFVSLRLIFKVIF